jgi:enhancer of mRNA-decapping protein 4
MGQDMNDGSSSSVVTTCFVTASHQNTVVTLWSSFTVTPMGPGNNQYEPPTKLQVINMVPNPTATTVPTSFVLDVCYGPAPVNAAPPSCFLLLGSRQAGRLFALHVRSVWSDNNNDNEQQQQQQQQQTRALCVGADYVVPFSLKHAIYSWSVMCSPTQDIAEEELQERAGLIFDMKCFSYQSKYVQCLTLTSYMCLPPEHSYKDNMYSGIVKVQPLTGKYVNATSSAASSLIGEATNTAVAPVEASSALDGEFEEDYDIDDDDIHEDADDDTPAAPVGIFPTAGNPFANWLGALAGGGAVARNPPPASSAASEDSAGLEGLPTPPPGLAPSASDDSKLLNPMELLAGNAAAAANEASSKQSSRSNSKKKGRIKSPKRSKSPKDKRKQRQDDDNRTPFPDGNVTILKRDDISANIAPPLPPDPSLVSDPAILAAAGIPLPPPPPQQSQVSSAEIEALVTKAVEETMAKTMVPAINKAIQESFASLARPLRTSMDNLSKQGVSVDANDLKNALNIEAPLKAAMADNMRNVLVPTLESVTSQMLQQVQNSMPEPPTDHTAKTLESLIQQLVTMNSKIDVLAKEVHTLRGNLAEQAAAAAAAAGRGNVGPSPPPPPGNAGQTPQQMESEHTRAAVNTLLQGGQYEAAFTKAVSASAADMALYCCTRADLNVVFGGPKPLLSQPIVLCLMQQLGAILSKTSKPSDLQTELAWLQECALSLNVQDPSIQRHVPGVLQQLVATVNSRMMTEGQLPNSQFRRPLQMLLQVLRGMQMG